MDETDDSPAGVVGDPAEVATVLQRHLGDGPESATVAAMQPVVEVVAGWRDPDDLSASEWLGALEATPDVLYLRVAAGFLRHRPEVDDDRREVSDPYRLVRTADASGEVEMLDRRAAVERLREGRVAVGVVADLTVDVRRRFL
jgi:hypothetical protein